MIYSRKMFQNKIEKMFGVTYSALYVQRIKL